MRKRVVIGILILFLIIIISGLILFVLKDKTNFFSGKITQSTESIFDEKCNGIRITPVKITNLTPENFSVTLFREGNSEEIGGVKLIFMNEDGSQSSSANIPENITAFENLSVLVLNVRIQDPSRVIAVAYFLDENGNETLCKNYTHLEF